MDRQTVFAGGPPFLSPAAAPINIKTTRYLRNGCRYSSQSAKLGM